ncbi:hypothetical protein HYU20_02365 [Candidatus Woesearchaeota archaeon]|nr:hypothetical protein [Candidatus Woesearchaeota archaeon]
MSTLQLNEKSKALADYAAAWGLPFPEVEGSFYAIKNFGREEINVTFYNPNRADLKTSAEGTALEIIIWQGQESLQAACEEGLTGKCAFLRLVNGSNEIDFLASKATPELREMMQKRYEAMLNQVYQAFCGSQQLVQKT